MAAPELALGSLDSPFGPMVAAIGRSGVVRLAYPEQDLDSVGDELALRLSARIVESPRRLDPLRSEVDAYFDGRLRRFRTPVDWALTGPFARRVLKATAAIPYGGYLSYGEVAAEAGSPRGGRAAGNALGSNPIALVVPCHRVLASGGAIGGYGGGIERKRLLLELEGTLAPGAGRARAQLPASTLVRALG
jgi:methylated-DNA-[protein]-cysteine S-methyltransferase